MMKGKCQYVLRPAERSKLGFSSENGCNFFRGNANLKIDSEVSKNEGEKKSTIFSRLLEQFQTGKCRDKQRWALFYFFFIIMFIIYQIIRLAQIKTK